MKKYIFSILSLLVSIFASAQEQSSVDSFMRSDRKIYVAVTVLFIILSCIFIFLFSLERRLKQLEDHPKS